MYTSSAIRRLHPRSSEVDYELIQLILVSYHIDIVIDHGSGSLLLYYK